MKKSLILFIILFVVLALGSVIYYKSAPGKNDHAKLKKVTVLLDWFPNTNHTGIYVAKDKGYFKEEGLEVDIIQPAEGDNLQVISSGKADFAVSSQEAVTLARDQELPIKSIAAVIRHNTSAFASLKNAGINTVKDFEGKRYGGWGSPIEEAVLKLVTKEAGTDYSKIKNITIGTTDFFATIGKESDFQWIFYGWDGVEAERRGIDLNLIWLKDLSPVLDYHTPVIATSDSMIAKDKETIKKFMNAVSRGYELAIESPDESAEILIKLVPEINAELAKESQKWLVPQYRAESPKWGYQEETFWTQYTNWLFEGGQIKNRINSKDLFTNEFLP